MPDIKADTVLSVTALTISAFGFFMPTVREIRKSDRNPDISDDMTSGALLAAGTVIGVGAVVSTLSGNWNRMLVSVAAVLVILAIYAYQFGDDNGIPSVQGILGSLTS